MSLPSWRYKGSISLWYIQAIPRIKELGVPVGTIAVTPEQAKHFADLGVSFLGVGADTAFLTQGADAALKMFKDGMK